MTRVEATPTAVVTGRGVISAGGSGVDRLLEMIGSGTSALGPAMVIGDAEVFGAPVGEIVGHGDGPMPRLSQIALAVAEQAIDEARLGPAELVTTPLILGSGSGERSPGDWELARRQPPKVTIGDGEERFFGAARRVVDELGLAPAVAINTACTSGANAIVHGFGLIRTGRARRVLCVGADELWAGLHLSFAMMGVISATSCRPFHVPDGTSLAEGAGAVVLEHPDAAAARGVPTFGALLGAGQSSDAFHLARPDGSGRGAELAVSRALASAGTTWTQVGFVLGHGTGTAANDAMEETLLADRFGPDTPLIGTKGLHGHTVGACGVIELIAALAVSSGQLTPAPVCFSPVPGEPAGDLGRRPQIGVKATYAMGGLNTALVTGPVSEPDAAVRTGLRSVHSVGEVWVRGSGWLDESGFDLEASIHALALDAGAIAQLTPHGWRNPPRLQARTWRRLDLLGKLVYSAAALVLGRLRCESLDNVGVSYATSAGPVLSWASVTAAMRAGRPINPALIPRLSYNAAPSIACEAFGLRGPTVAYVGASAGVAALEHAAMTLELGAAQAMLVIAADEYTGVEADDDGIERLSGLDRHESIFHPVHRAVLAPREVPSVACLLLVGGAAARAAIADDESAVRVDDVLTVAPPSDSHDQEQHVAATGSLRAVIDDIRRSRDRARTTTGVDVVREEVMTVEG